ncbi:MULTISPECIES: DUF4142 domain-containing protein [Legionella]|uniref:DUF4142 domain-containing protein n=1 Tax=Legionella septentrionalis TaxID=2498109 RepID=A0A433JGB6_9GAMM|nr:MULTISPECIES: DUF4142 domain-containing protein [Legionella]MCP0913230.1 DUF4142 domain-containing protein [Legionella sp. 27cVA30]RUQ79159.1 DUF4142 domain-containing protein [Legionella septentrionalis]RUR02394.1 DUF4142 domain-containing protein [Legionella septentrionalis]RUR17051.1 DUF4142 domain-containing protein [Legionella septentrionalis]
MKQKTIYSLVLSCSLLAACANNPNPNFPMMTAKQSNSQVVGDLVVLNKNEIAAANLAAKKAASPTVRRYAAFLAREHRTNLQTTLSLGRKIGSPSEMSDLSRSLQTQGQQEMAQLNSLSNAAFDRAYIDSMVKDHQEAIQLIDQQLLKNSTNPTLTKHLEKTRHHISMHLEKARLIQRELNGVQQ